MTTFYINSNEWYPVYTIDHEKRKYHTAEIELTETEEAEYRKVCDDFEAWQLRFQKPDNTERDKTE